MRRTVSILALLWVIACGTQPVSRQVQPGTIAGTIVEETHTPLPGVTVTLSGDKVAARTAVTDAHGTYRFTGVPPGTYRITAHLPGFGPAYGQAEVASNAGAWVELRLRLGTMSETIAVTAEAPAAHDAAGTFVSKVARQSSTSFVATAPPPAYVPEQLPVERRYSKINEHAFIDTAKERTTTFAIDVDTASYANVRRYLHANQTPPGDAVRIEEMVNYFSYAYPQPRGPEPFSITADTASCPWNANHRLLRIGLQGRHLDQWKAAPNNLVFLIDVSGSMQSPNKLPLVKSALQLLVEQLRAEDFVSIVVYAGTEGLVLPKTSGADKLKIRQAIATLNAGGSTAGGAGITLAYKVAQENFLPNGNNRVILATDGDFNVGISNVDDLQKLIEEKRKSGVFLTTVGVGEGNYRDQVLETLANKGNGNCHYLDTIAEARKVFTRDLMGNLVTIAKDVKVQIEFNPALVASYRQIGYENRALANQDFTDDTKDAGELGAGHSVTALYEIVPAPGRARGELAKIRLRYKEPNGETSREIVTNAIEDGRSIYDAPADFQFAVAVAQFGMLLRNSPNKGTSTFADALALAKQSRGVDLDGFREEMIRMIETSAAILGEPGKPAIARRE